MTSSSGSSWQRWLVTSLLCPLLCLLPRLLCPLLCVWPRLLDAAPLRVVFTGDTNFAESYQVNFTPNVLAEAGYDYHIAEVGRLARRATAVIINLETPLTTLRQQPYRAAKSYVHWSSPRKVPPVLRSYGVVAASLANNHAMDMGLVGLRHTIAALTEAAIVSFGAGGTTTAAARPYVQTFPRQSAGAGASFQLVVAGGFEYRQRYQQKYRFYAVGERGGTNGWTTAGARGEMERLRRQYPQGYIVAYPHWGRNYCWRTKWQQQMAHALIDGGADLVVGHGAHMLQEIEQYRGRWVVYSLGNYVFNTRGRFSADKKPPFSLVAELLVSEDGAMAMRLYPIFSNNLLTSFRPRFVTKAEFQKVIAVLARHSFGCSSNGHGFFTTGSDQIGRYLQLSLGTLPIGK